MRQRESGRLPATAASYHGSPSMSRRSPFQSRNEPEAEAREPRLTGDRISGSKQGSWRGAVKSAHADGHYVPWRRRWVVGARSSHAHVPRRGPGGLAGHSVFEPEEGWRAVAEPADLPCLQRLPVSPPNRSLARFRSVPAAADTRFTRNVPADRTLAGGVLLPHSARSVGAVSPCPAHEMLPVASCSKSTTILPVGRVGGVLCRPSRGGKRASTRVQSTASVSCAFSMPPARSIGRPAPAGLAACGSGSDLAAGAQAGVGMLMSSPGRTGLRGAVCPSHRS